MIGKKKKFCKETAGKGAAVAGSGAVIVWIGSLFGVEVPIEVAGAVASIVGYMVGLFHA